MNISLSCLFMCLFHLGYGQDVKEEFIKSKIVPDVISTSPEEIIDVNYPDNVVRLGNEIALKDTIYQPEIDFTTKPNSYHTLIMVDPDVDEFRNILHWLVVNIPESNVAQGQTKAEYLPPEVPENTGSHRYVFLMYEQDVKKEFDYQQYQPRVSFSVKDFEKKYELKGPIAGNFFVSHRDELIPNSYQISRLNN